MTKGNAWIFMDSGECTAPLPYSVDLQTGINRYPDPTGDTLRDAIASTYGLKRENVFLGCGIDEVLDRAITTFSPPGGKLLSFEPTFPPYRIFGQTQGRTYISVPLTPDFGLQEEAAIAAARSADIVFICSPNNPTGTVLDPGVITKIIDAAPGLVVIDEAYGEFCELQNLPVQIDSVRTGAKNVLVTRTFSKAYAAAGIRLGYGLASTEIIGELLKTKLPYNVNALSQSIGCSLLEGRSAMEENVRALLKSRALLAKGCKELGCTVSRSVTHFFLLQLPERYSAGNFYQFLRNTYRIAVRPFGIINGKESLRVSTGTDEQNNLFLKALSAFLSSKSL